HFARRLKTLKGLTPYEFICKQWNDQPERFRINPYQLIAGLNTPLMAGLNTPKYWDI
ncbi:integrase, partial [Neisseria shayeganii 871]